MNFDPHGSSHHPSPVDASIFGGCSCCEGIIACNVTLGAYNTYKFLEIIQTKIIPSLY